MMELIGQLQIVLRYSKLVVTNESLPFIRTVGVHLRATRTTIPAAENNSSTNTAAGTTHAFTSVASITPGMEFTDGQYLMRVTLVTDIGVQAKRTYQVHDNNRTTRVIDCDHVITYTDIADIKSRIQEML